MLKSNALKLKLLFYNSLHCKDNNFKFIINIFMKLMCKISYIGIS